MKTNYTLKLDNSNANLSSTGGKGASLAKLMQAGIPVPDGFHVTTRAYQHFVEENNLLPIIEKALKKADINKVATLQEAEERIKTAFLAGVISGKMAKEIATAYQAMGADAFTAVRSSATAEDLPDLSFAGQQETFLNVRGEKALLETIKKCWASLWTARAIGYRMRNSIDQKTVQLAVVVQELVPADSAGVLFTANPANGRRDEMVVNSVWGLGEVIVSGNVTPDSFVVDKETLSIKQRDIAEKTKMTSRVESGTEEMEVPAEKRRAASISEEHIEELAKLGKLIETLYGMPMDIEWALAEDELAIVQARPITALPQPSTQPPTEWLAKEQGAMYIRASIVEQLPDPASPLFATLAPEQMSKSIGDMVRHIMPRYTYINDMLGFTTINEYFYMYVQMEKGSFLRMYLDAIPILLKRGENNFFQMGAKHWKEDILPDYEAKVSEWQSKSLESRSAHELISGVKELLYWGTRMFTGVQLVMPLVSMSEGFFTLVYNKFIKRKDGPKASEFMVGFESEPIRAEKSMYDLAMWTLERKDLSRVLQETDSETIWETVANNRILKGVGSEWKKWAEKLKDHLDTFGHATFNLDFVNAVVADDPRPVIDTIKFYLSGKGTNPHQRQQEMTDHRKKITAQILEKVGPLRRKMFLRRLKWAQESAPHREDSLAAVGLGWPLLRRMLRELGNRLVKAGAIHDKDDIFWTKAGELMAYADELDAGKLKLQDMSADVEQRKMTWRGNKQAIPPQFISSKKGLMSWMYDKMGPAGDQEQTGNVIKGMSIGGGTVTGIARVLHGPQDFGQMQPGDVLVAGITTPAWTPLFAMASAVVTEVGGVLSHSSIVAREYGIPAVTATGVATKRILSGQRIKVDGDAGLVTLLD